MSGKGPYSPGDLVWVYRGARPGKASPAKVISEPWEVGGTLGVSVTWWSPDLAAHTDFIALTHVEPRKDIFAAAREKGSGT